MSLQHWHIYTKWNRNLFSEMHRAYEQGRLTIDPSDNWVKGECGFFDFYVIPLAQKLDACGVFGVTSDEFHNYAVQNRKEWEQKGPAMLAEYKERMQFETQTQTRSSF